MNRVIEAVPYAGLKAADLANSEAMLESYYELYTPLLLAENKGSMVAHICEG